MISCHVRRLFCLTELFKPKLTVTPLFKIHRRPWSQLSRGFGNFCWMRSLQIAAHFSLKKACEDWRLFTGVQFSRSQVNVRGLRWRLPSISLPSADTPELIFSHSLTEGMLPLKKKGYLKSDPSPLLKWHAFSTWFLFWGWLFPLSRGSRFYQGYRNGQL